MQLVYVPQETAFVQGAMKPVVKEVKYEGREQHGKNQVRGTTGSGKSQVDPSESKMISQCGDGRARNDTPNDRCKANRQADMDKVKHSALKRLLSSCGEKTLSDGEKYSYPEDYRKVVVKRVYLLYQFFHRLVQCCRIRHFKAGRDRERPADRSIRMEMDRGGAATCGTSCATRETATSRPPRGFALLLHPARRLRDIRLF